MDNGIGEMNIDAKILLFVIIGDAEAHEPVIIERGPNEFSYLGKAAFYFWVACATKLRYVESSSSKMRRFSSRVFP